MNFLARTFLKPLKRVTRCWGAGHLWTELVRTRQHLGFLLFPRIAALSEAAWAAGDSINYDRLSLRLTTHLKLYQKMGIYYYNPFVPAETPELPGW